MKLIIGLWNPWDKYKITKHNVWFMFLDFLKDKEWFSEFSTENKFKSGPHFQYRIAQLQKGKKGLFIFKIDAQKTIPFPVARYNKAKGKWVTITKVDKYLKIIQKYRKRQKWKDKPGYKPVN